MKLSECLIPEAVEAQVSASDKNACLERLVDLLEHTDGFMDRDKLVKEIKEREALGSTGIGKGVAIPHIHIDGVDRLHVSMMTTGSGVDFDAIDDEPCRIFIMVVAPDSQREMYLQLLSEVSRLFREDDVRESVLSAGDTSGLIGAIENAESE